MIAAVSLCLIGASAPPAKLPGWMAGCWMDTQGNRWTEECWTAPRAGIMIGSGRSGSGDALESWETMQIVLDASAAGTGKRVPLAFFGAPRGEGRTMFVWKPGAGEGEGVGFENPAHDYPQRIRYWREGERLMAEISRIDGTRAMRWSFRRSGSPN